MSRMLAVLLLALAASCPGTDPPPDKKTCNTVSDCNIDQHCSHGFCEDNGSEGEGAGEGEGEGEDALTAFCNAQAGCIGEPAGGCIHDGEQALDQLRAIGTQVCLDAIAAEDSALTCATTQPCSVLQNQSAIDAACPDGLRAQQLINECTGQAGEGEGEGEPLQCPQAAVMGAASERDSIPTLVTGEFDQTVSSACLSAGALASASLRIVVNADPQLVTGGQTSFDGGTVIALQDVVAIDSTTITATACALDHSNAELALQLFVLSPDGATSLASPVVCGSLGITIGEGEGEGGQ